MARSSSSSSPDPAPSRSRNKGKGRAVSPSSSSSGSDVDPTGDTGMDDATQENGEANGVKGEEEESSGESDLEGVEDGERARRVEEKKSRRKKALRLEYRALQGRVDDARGDLNNTTVHDLSAQVTASNRLFAKVSAPSEAVLDSRVLIATSEAGALKARQLKIDADAFDTDEFLSRLKGFLGIKAGGGGGGKGRRRKGGDDSEEDELDDGVSTGAGKVSVLKWNKVGKVLSGESRRVPALDFMYGPLALEIKEKKARTQRAKNKMDEAERVRPEELHAEDVAKNENETGKVTAKIARVLLEKCGEVGIPYLAFVINPDSFSQTVENMFYFSFLMRENKVAIEVDTDADSPYFGDVITFSVDDATAEQQAQKGSGAPKHQVVMELTEEVWKDAIEAYNITESMIPSRAAYVPPVKNGAFKW